MSIGDLIPSFMSGTGALPVWAAGALAALLVCAGVLAFRRAVAPGTAGALWRVGLVVVGAALAWTVLDLAATRDRSAARKALDARTAELTLRAIAPDSPLACLDALANATVEAACEKALFASPEKIAAAVSYVDARLTLLTDALELVARDPALHASLERLRRSIESDRFGFVAHVLATRGCGPDDCTALKLMRDPSRVAANLRERTFDANVVLYAAAWRQDGPVLASVPAPAPAAAVPPPATSAASASAAPVSSKYDFPSAGSIPPISIMNAEPQAPPTAEPAQETKPAPPARTAPARRQSAREPTDNSSAANAPPPVAAAPATPPNLR